MNQQQRREAPASLCFYIFSFIFLFALKSRSDLNFKKHSSVSVLNSSAADEVLVRRCYVVKLINRETVDISFSGHFVNKFDAFANQIQMVLK